MKLSCSSFVLCVRLWGYNKWILCGPFLGKAYNLVGWRQGDTETDYCKVWWIGVWAPRWEQWIPLLVGPGRNTSEDGWRLNGFLTDEQRYASWSQNILKQEKQCVLCHERARDGGDHHRSWRIEFTWGVMGNEAGGVGISGHWNPLGGIRNCFRLEAS